MPFEFKLPDLGEGVHEGEVVRWLVAEGDLVAEDQPLVEVMTDKVTAEIPSPRAGKVLRLLVPPGEVVPVGTALVAIEEIAAAITGNGNGQRAEEVAEHGAVPVELPTNPIEQPPATPAPATPGPQRRERATAVPAVRKLARELGIELGQVAGTGPSGRITMADVRAAAGTASQTPTPAPATPQVQQPSPTGGRRIPMRGLRRRIAERMLIAAHSTAPYTYVEEADFTELVNLREKVRAQADAQGSRLTFLPFIMLAAVAALKEHPTLNATVDAETNDLILSDEYHFGIAAQTDEGLVVPVLKNAEKRGVLDLARELARLTEVARTGKLTLDDVQGGTFSITSLGPLGGIAATPILNLPQVAILAIGKIAARPVVRDGQVVIRQMANLSLTLDHRYIDGMVGAEFVRTLIGYLEDPAMMLFWHSELREPSAVER